MRVASSLSKSKQQKVAVFAFVGPGEEATLGQKLAEEFREALVKSAHDFQVVDRSRLLEILGKTNAISASINDADTASWFLRDSEVDSSILGTLTQQDSSLNISLQIFRVWDAHRISTFETSLPLSDDLRALISMPAGSEFGNWPKGGKNGYSAPTCISCPYPRYTGLVTGRNFQDMVILEISVDEDGRARHIRVKKALLNDMTEEAIAAVQKWRFKPATGPDGKAAAVREMIEVTFRSY
jgi:TonB family protein